MGPPAFPQYGEDTTDSGACLRLRTDQVRFCPIGARDGQDPVEPVPMTDIPPLVLSEVLCDVDLFVGLASVGNDPTWQDDGPGGLFRE